MSLRPPQNHDANPTDSVGRCRGADQWLRRRRLERQLHDGAALRLSALSLRLGLLGDQSAVGAENFQRQISELQDELHAVLQELRQIADKIYPPLLNQAGIGPALRELAAEAGIELAVTDGADRFDPAAEGAAYFMVADCLAAEPVEPPAPIRVTVYRDGRLLVLSLGGLPTCHAELAQYHVGPLGGSVTTAVEPAELTNTPPTNKITVRIPCE